MFQHFIIIRKTEILIDEFFEYFFNDKYLITLERESVYPHFHILLYTDKTIETTRKFLQKYYKEKKQISVKKCRDTDKSKLYILKEQNIIKNNLLDEEELNLLIEKVNQYQEERKDKKNYLRYLNEIYEPIDDEFFNIDKIKIHIFNFLLDNLKLDDKGFDKIIFRRFLNGIIIKHYDCLNLREYFINDLLGKKMKRPDLQPYIDNLDHKLDLLLGNFK